MSKLILIVLLLSGCTGIVYGSQQDQVVTEPEPVQVVLEPNTCAKFLAATGSDTVFSSPEGYTSAGSNCFVSDNRNTFGNTRTITASSDRFTLETDESSASHVCGLSCNK